MLPVNHTRFIIACITFISSLAALCGAWLLWKGFAGGGELVMTVNTAIAGMIGFLSNQPKPPQTGAGGAITTEVINSPTRPVETHEAAGK